MKFGFHRALNALLGLVALASIATAGTAASAPDARASESGMIAFRLDLPALSPQLIAVPFESDIYRLGAFETAYPLGENAYLVSAVNVDIARVIDGYANTAFGGLFHISGAARSPFLTRTGSAYSGVRLMLREGLRFSLGQAFASAGHTPYPADSQSLFWRLNGDGLPFDTNGTTAALAGLSWDFAAWGNISLTASRTEARSTLEALPKATSAALGVSARVGLGGGWVTTLSYAQANAQLRLNTGSLADGALHSQSYGIAVAKHGLFGKDALGLSLSRPAGGYNAGALANDVQQFQFYGRDKLFAGLMPETDIEVGYVTNFLNRSVALDVNAAYQMNYKGQNKDEVSFISRAKIKF